MKKEAWEDLAKRIKEAGMGQFELGVLYGLSANIDKRTANGSGDDTPPEKQSA